MNEIEETITQAIRILAKRSTEPGQDAELLSKAVLNFVEALSVLERKCAQTIQQSGAVKT